MENDAKNSTNYFIGKSKNILNKIIKLIKSAPTDINGASKESRNFVGCISTFLHSEIGDEGEIDSDDVETDVASNQSLFPAYLKYLHFFSDIVHY